MKKKAEYTKKDSTWNKAEIDEPLFILRAQDASAPDVILHWMERNAEFVPKEKLEEAFECVKNMMEWNKRKRPD